MDIDDVLQGNINFTRNWWMWESYIFVSKTLRMEYVDQTSNVILFHSICQRFAAFLDSHLLLYVIDKIWSFLW